MAQIVNGYFVIETAIMNIIKKIYLIVLAFLRSLQGKSGQGIAWWSRKEWK